MSFSLRPAMPEDLVEIHQLNRLIEIADRIPIVTPLEEFLDWNDDPNFSFADDSRVAEVDGRIVGYGRMWFRPSDSGQSRAFMLGGVEPSYRQRGIGSALLSWQLERGRELVGSGPDGLPRFVRTQAYEFETDAIALYERHGLRPIRYYDELLRPLDPIEPVPAIPGIELQPWDNRRNEDLRLLHNLSFADHWGSTPLDQQAWQHRIESFGVRTDLSWMALGGDRIVSFSLNAHYPSDEELTGRRDGWVFSLGTDPNYRKMGIASALVIASCHSFAEAGFTHGALGVDSENPTGAYRIYERLGFRPLHRSVQHQIEM